MRVRNPKTGTVLSAGDNAAQRLLAQGWENLDAPSSAAGSGESTASKPRRSRKSTNTDTDSE